MSAEILSDVSFPHGTPSGFREGCRGSHCPAIMACRDVHRRYQGEFGFRRLFDAGFTLERILEVEQAEAVAAEVAARAARIAARAAKRSKPKPAPKPKIADPARPKRMLYPHGTHQSWRRGCRTVEGCTEPVGLTCVDAHRTYQRERYASGYGAIKNQRRREKRQA